MPRPASKNEDKNNDDQQHTTTTNASFSELSEETCGSAASVSAPPSALAAAAPICCVGMCVLDVIHVCATYPVEDTDKRCLAGHMQRGGNASNMCTVLRSLGHERVEFLGMLSTAPGFEFLRSDCERRDIRTENCPTVAEKPPFSSVILVEHSDSRTIVHSNSNFPILKYEHFAKVNLDDYCWFHFEARNPAETLRMQRAIHAHNARAQRRRIKISVEFEKLLVENLILALGADYIFLGKELACHMGWLGAEQAVHGLRQWIGQACRQPHVEAWQQRQQQMRPAAIICPWGAVGTGTLSAAGEYSFVPVEPPAKIVDALGAGDTFCAATIFGLATCDAKLERAVELATIIAGLKLEQYGFDGMATKLSLAHDRLLAREAARSAARVE